MNALTFGRLAAAVGVSVLFGSDATHVHGQTLTVLASFNGNNGQLPQADLTLSGNTLYGTTTGGGANGYGTVFSVPVTGGSPTVLASFDGSNGRYPAGGLTISGNNLYGTTYYGGTIAGGMCGVVFSVPVTGGSPTVLASFDGSNGQWPEADLTLSGNILYGTTNEGGANGYGTVFSVPVTGGSPTVLTSFNGSNGQYLYAGVTISGNNLYGTTEVGGDNGDGVVFSLPLSGGSPTVLASFNGSNGQYPWDDLTISGNNLYGTTVRGGANGYGTVFSVPVTGGSPTVLASFDGSNGQYPWAGLTLSDNTLYGTTTNGGTNGGWGVVFSVPLSGGSPTVLASFDGSNGGYPDAGLMLSDNTLYGTTNVGGDNNDGTVFAIQSNSTPEPSTLALFAAGAFAPLALVLRRRRAA